MILNDVAAPIGFPSPPQNLSYKILPSGDDSVNLTVRWEPPQYDGGVQVNYTLTVSPDLSPGLSPLTINSTSFTVTLPDVPSNITVLATNCIGSSSVAVTTIMISMLTTLD